MRALALLLALIATPVAAAGPVAVELFTSQGCSSCPPADALVQRLAHEPGIVAISRPVTYWDRLGWKDTLARPENTALQRAYVARGGSGQVFTPQLFVAGGPSVIGSREGELRKLIANAAKAPGPTIAVEHGAAIVRGPAARPAQLVLVALTSSVQVPIGRGENGGRRITYANVVRAERVVGQWRGGAVRFAVPALKVPGADARALILREGESGPILAATYL